MAQRDTQRQKVYRAEDAAFDKSRADGLSVEACQALVDKWCASKVLQRHYPQARVPVRITDGRGRRRASYFTGRWRPDGTYGATIAIPRWARSKWIVAHELAHHLHNGRGAAPHGWQFAECYLYLVRVYISKSAEERLKQEFKAGRVKFRAPVKRNMTPEQREAARQRMLALHAARAEKQLAPA